MPGLPEDPPAYAIGRVEALTGLSARKIRYYEQQGLLAAQRSAGRQRLYTHEQVELLLLIKRLRAEGYSLKAVRAMIRQGRPGERGGEAARAAAPVFRGEEAVSLYPMINRTRLLEILDRLERRDRARRPEP